MVLQRWLQEVEKIKAGVLTQQEMEIGKKSQDSIETILDRYAEYLRSKSAKEKHIDSIKQRITTICTDCKFRTISEINHDALSDAT